MTVSTLLTPKIRKGIVHFIVLAFIIKFLFIPFGWNSDFPAKRWNIYINSIVIICFYIHTFLLLPILLNKNKPIKYVLYLISIYLSVVGSFIWYESIRLSKVSTFFDSTTKNGVKKTPLDMLVHNGYDLLDSRTFLYLGFFFLLCWISSLIYYTLFAGREQIKKMFSFKYLELTINIIIVSSIFSFLCLNTNSRRVFIMTILYFTLTLLFFYTNAFFITPVLLKEKKISRYLFYAICLFILYVLSSRFIAYITDLEIISLQNVIFFVFSFFIDYVLSFIYGFIRHRIKNKDVVLGAKESELKLLKSQVNPHFLFNTLNTLYSTALEENAPKTAESTAKLASLIRYMQEDINKDFIPLENEIKYLENYISIQKLRCFIEPDIETKFSHIENHKLSPGLLIPFVENAFKYGIDPSKKSKLSVSIICEKNTISFECINTYDENYKTYYKEQGFGIGIKNAKQRLEQVYPKKHTIDIKKENNIFSVKINLNITNK